jgi:hypothetical protein
VSIRLNGLIEACARVGYDDDYNVFQTRDGIAFRGPAPELNTDTLSLRIATVQSYFSTCFFFFLSGGT